ncbi:MAG TPA: hypothetical protein DCK87_00910 [Desulfotomaculum sp.]|nr:hypothetical protein [Desulfotomaculum sp.]
MYRINNDPGPNITKSSCRYKNYLSNPSPYYQLFTQFIRFGLVGIVSTFTHVGTLAFLVELLNFPPIPASTIGFILAVVVSYILNHRFTFGAQGNHGIYFVGAYCNTPLLGLSYWIVS